MDGWDTSFGEAYPKRQKLEDSWDDGGHIVQGKGDAFSGDDWSLDSKGKGKGFDWSQGKGDDWSQGKGDGWSGDNFSFDSKGKGAGDDWLFKGKGMGKGDDWSLDGKGKSKGGEPPQLQGDNLLGDSFSMDSKGKGKDDDWSGDVFFGDTWSKGEDFNAKGNFKGKTVVPPPPEQPWQAGDNWSKGKGNFKGGDTEWIPPPPPGLPKQPVVVEPLKGQGKVIPACMPPPIKGKGKGKDSFKDSSRQDAPQGGNTEPPVRKKNKLCEAFMNSAGTNCPRGKCCTYAHGEAELGQPIAPELVFNMVNKVKMKLKLCNSFTLTGSCFKGDLCTFAHGEHEVGTPQPILTEEQKAAQAAPPKFQGNFKTVLCKHFPQGNCTRGDLCAFAHGEQDLGTPTPWLKSNTNQDSSTKGGIRTEICQEYFDKGECPFGRACPYIHSEEEVGAPGPRPPQNQMQNQMQIPIEMQNMMQSMMQSMMQATTNNFNTAQMQGAAMSNQGQFAAPATNFNSAQMQGGAMNNQGQFAATAMPGNAPPQFGSTAMSGSAPGQFGGAAIPMTAPAAAQPQEDEQTKMWKFKTVLCQDFSNRGTCASGDTCQNAHGLSDLLQPGEALRIMQQKMQASQAPPVAP